MENEKPQFEVPEAASNLTKGEMELLLPADEEAVIYDGLQKTFIEHVKPKAVRKRTQKTKR